MKITMYKCDVKKCGKIVEEKESHHITIGTLKYDLCNTCFPEFDKWIRETLENGQAIAEEIKATGTWGIPWMDVNVAPGTTITTYPSTTINTDPQIIYYKIDDTTDSVNLTPGIDLTPIEAYFGSKQK